MVKIRTKKGNTMKLKYMFLAAASVLALGSCVRDAISPLTGKYPAPESYEMTKVLAQPVEKSGNVRIFTLELATEGISGTEGNWQGTGAVLRIKFVGDKYFLHDAAYTAAPSGNAQKGNYIVGQEGSAFSIVNGDQSHSIGLDYGSITVLSDNGSYKISGTLWLADESTVKVNASINLTYEPDPEPIRLTKVISAVYNNNLITLNLATEGVNATDNGMGGFNWSGNGQYLALDIYSSDGNLAPGIYKPSSKGGEAGAGQWGIGWDPGDLWGIGMVFTNWGTCWWSVADGAVSAEKLSSGDITVTKTGSSFTISYNSNGLWIEFNGAIDQVNGEKVEYTELAQCLSAVYNGAQSPDNKSITLNLGTADVTSTPNAWGGVDFGGSGNYLAIDIYSEDGKLKPGTYRPCATAGTVSEGEFGIGWDPGDIGWGFPLYNWGTCWWTIASGGNTAVHITDGQIRVESNDGTYTVTIESSAVNAKYTGAVTL